MFYAATVVKPQGACVKLQQNCLYQVLSKLYLKGFQPIAWLCGTRNSVIAAAGDYLSPVGSNESNCPSAVSVRSSHMEGYVEPNHPIPARDVPESESRHNLVTSHPAQPLNHSKADAFFK